MRRGPFGCGKGSGCTISQHSRAGAKRGGQGAEQKPCPTQVQLLQMCPPPPSTALQWLYTGMFSEGKAWNPNCTGFGLERGTRRTLGSSPAVGRSSALTSRLDRLGLQLPAEEAPSLACLCDHGADQVGVGGSRSIPPEQNLPSHHHGAIPGGTGDSGQHTYCFFPGAFIQEFRQGSLGMMTPGRK